jgi:predicted enzyme related to lactoylglutathione lyase
MPKTVGAINGGFYEKTKPDEQVRLTILVVDIRRAIKKIKAAGGKVLGEPFELPGIGLFVAFMDTEGNVSTIYQDFTLKQLPETK